MAPHNNKDMSLVLSSDAKPRLKWTQELHQRFVDAVIQLGGAEKATPKSLMRVMGVCGLTLYHLKSHLQKYRLGRSQLSQTCQQIKQEENEDKDNISICAHEEINESLQVAQALQMQMDVQKKLQEQIEVQKHLQLRIEAQGKYLQSVLKKAQDALLDYGCSSSEVEQVKAQLGQLVSMVDSGCSSSLTSSDSSGSNHKRKESPIMLSLMEMQPMKGYSNVESTGNQKRSRIESNRFDLNFEFDSSIIDLNKDI